MTKPDSIDWKGLRQTARDMAAKAYAPYSEVHVGAAGLCDNGVVIAGCNVENASYPLGLCAECGLVSDLHRSGDGGNLIAVSIVAGDGNPLAPCGRCRQLLYEFGGPKLLIDSDPDPIFLATLLPHAFGPEDLINRAGL